MQFVDVTRARRWARGVLAKLVLAGLVLTPALAPAQHEHHAHPAPAATQDHRAHGALNPAADGAKPVSAQGTRVSLADTPLRDQHGRSLRFKSDAVGDRIVVVDFVYTTCTTVCPVLSAVMAQVQGRLDARVGRDVALLSVTVDPVRDTPARLKTYSEGVGAKPGWTWLTGAKPQVDEVLKALGAYTANYAEHPPLVLVGDARTGQWLRFYGFPTPDQLVAAVAELSAARAKAGVAG